MKTKIEPPEFLQQAMGINLPASYKATVSFVPGTDEAIQVQPDDDRCTTFFLQKNGNFSSGRYDVHFVTFGDYLDCSHHLLLTLYQDLARDLQDALSAEGHSSRPTYRLR